MPATDVTSFCDKASGAGINLAEQIFEVPFAVSDADRFKSFSEQTFRIEVRNERSVFLANTNMKHRPASAAKWRSCACGNEVVLLGGTAHWIVERGRQHIGPRLSP